MNAMPYSVGTVAVVPSLAASGAWAQSSAGGTGGSMVSGPGGMLEKTPSTVTADVLAVDTVGLAQRCEINRKPGVFQTAGE